MRVLIDECVPRRFKKHLSDHECHTVPEAGYSGKKNGELLLLAEKDGFDAFLTIDRGMQYQWKPAEHSIAVVLVRVKSSRLSDLLPHVPHILTTLQSIRAGEFVTIGT